MLTLANDFPRVRASVKVSITAGILRSKSFLIRNCFLPFIFGLKDKSFGEILVAVLAHSNYMFTSKK